MPYPVIPLEPYPPYLFDKHKPMKTKKQLKQEIRDEFESKYFIKDGEISVEKIVDLGYFLDQAIDRVIEATIEAGRVNKIEQEFKNIQDVYDSGDSADVGSGHYEIGYNEAIDRQQSQIKRFLIENSSRHIYWTR